FGPLLIHFIRNPNLYLGEEQASSFGHRIFRSVSPISTAPGKRFGQCCPRTCLGSALALHKTSYSMDPCCYLPNALYWFWALLCFCGTGVIRPRFSYLPPGLGFLLVGGTLVAYPNSVPPLINHWTPAFPAFYVALALPVWAWVTAGKSELEPHSRWILPAPVGIALLVLGWCNLNFYFH